MTLTTSTLITASFYLAGIATKPRNYSPIRLEDSLNLLDFLRFHYLLLNFLDFTHLHLVMEIHRHQVKEIHRAEEIHLHLVMETHLSHLTVVYFRNLFGHFIVFALGYPRKVYKKEDGLFVHLVGIQLLFLYY